MEAVAAVDGLTKVYRNDRGIRDVTMTVREGDIYGFFGPNGAGKTTVMKIMTGLSRADRGSVRLFGHAVDTHFEQAMAQTGSLIETAEAYTYMSARRNLQLAARFYPEADDKRIDEVLEWVGLASFASEKVKQYSLGMKQRLGIAAALLSQPRLLILDEPTNGLDIEGMVQVRELIVRLAREQRITFLISSHLIHEMELMCNRIGIMHHGRLIREAAVAELTADGSTLEMAYLREIERERGLAAHG